MKKVIIVDDEMVNRKLTASYLMELGYQENEIIEFKDGREVIDAIQQIDISDIGYMLLDIYMPEVNGIKVIEFFKSNEKFKNIPIIVMTTDDRLNTGIEKNVESFLIRPVTFNTFVKTISQYVEEE